MRPEDRVRAAAELGFTERQARFLVTVMLHSGVCLLRQYTAFAGIVHGQKTRTFFDKLIRRGYATAYPCRHNRGRVYHIDHKPLYRVVGDADCRFRRPMSAASAVENLMVLYALIATPSDSWLTADEGGATRRQRAAVGCDLTGRAVMVYVITDPRPIDLHTTLQRHLPRVTTLPEWTLRIVMPRYLEPLRAAVERDLRYELMTPVPQLVKEVRWYFQQRRARTLEHATIDDTERYDEAQFAFGAPRYQALYQRWRQEGDAAFEAVSSAAAAVAITSGAGRVEYHVLPYSYRHLSPIVDAAAVLSMGAEEGEEAGTAARPPLTHPGLAIRGAVERLTRPGARRIQLIARRALAAARRAERRKQGRRSLPPQESGVGTAAGA